MMMMMLMMMMMPTKKIFSKMYFVWTREMIGQQVRTRIRRAFGDDDDGNEIEMSSSSPLPIFFFYARSATK